MAHISRRSVCVGVVGASFLLSARSFPSNTEPAKYLNKFPVDVYGRPGCARTRSAVTFFFDRDIRPSLHNVDIDRKAALKFAASGLDLLPLIEIDGAQVDYDADAILRALRVALKKQQKT